MKSIIKLMNISAFSLYEIKNSDFEKYKFKLRSLPNSTTLPKYVKATMNFVTIWAIYNFVTICLVYSDFKLRFPSIFVIALPAYFFHVYMNIEQDFLNVNRETMKEMIVHIRLGQFQSLKEKIEINPEILKEKCEGKSLLYWAKYYKNYQVHNFIVSELRKGKQK